MRTFLLAAAALALTAAGAPSQESKPAARLGLFVPSDTPLPADTYCTINGYPLLRTEYGAWLQKHKGDAFIREYVTGKLVRDAAKAAGAEATPEEIRQRIDQKIEERTLAAYRGRKELFVERELAAFGKTLDQFRTEQSWETETELLIQKTLRARRLTTDADVDREFKRLYGSSGRELWLRAILIEWDIPTITSHKPVEEIQRLTAEGIERSRRQGIDIVKRLQSGALDFASAARAYSDDGRSRMVGGDIGKYINDPLEFGEEFDATVHKAKVGQILGPVRIQAGFLVAEITKEVPHDLRAERDAIRKALQSREATPNEVQEFTARLLIEAKLLR